MTKFFVVRHGQSEGNAKEMFLGHTDLELTEFGHKQAMETARYLANKKIDKIYTSDLRRAYSTAQHIGDLTGISPVCHKGLREIFAGEWEGLPFKEISKNFPNYQVWLSDIGRVRCDGGESTEELLTRLKETMTKIAKDNDGKNVCIVTHGCAIRVMCTWWMGLSLSEAKNIPWVSNNSVSEVIYDNGKWSYELIGYDEHLGNLRTHLPPNV